MKHSLIVRFKDGTEKKFLNAKIKASSDIHDLLYFDALPDGTWRMSYDDKLVEDFSKIASFNIHREIEECRPTH